MRLGSLAKLLRSKNAGPFMLTIDVLFPDRPSYELGRSLPVFAPDRIGALYGVEPGDVRTFDIPDFLAIKISFPRPVASGAEGDSDVYGCQYMARLARLEIEAEQRG